MNRCRTEKQFEQTVELINNFKQYFMRYGEKTDENPSPGNKAGGITTLEDKSLGYVQKGGGSPVEDVLLYGQEISKKGLSLLQAPGKLRDELFELIIEISSGRKKLNPKIQISMILLFSKTGSLCDCRLHAFSLQIITAVRYIKYVKMVSRR